MPKKLKELSRLTIGLRHRLIFEAVENYGLATIADVLNYVAGQADLDIRKANVKATLKKTIENDLRSFIGGKGKLSVRYYHRDGVTEVPSADIEENKDGTVKNKYSIKYYIIGGGIQIPGVALLDGCGVHLEPLNSRITKLKVDPAHLVKEANRYTIVFEKSGNDFNAVNFDVQDLPIGFLICGPNSDFPSRKKLADQYGMRTVILKFDHISVDRYSIEASKTGHIYLCITEDQKIELVDCNSLNKTFYCEITSERRDLIFSEKIRNPITSKIHNKNTPLLNVDEMPFESYFPFRNMKPWKQVKEEITLKGDGYLIKIGDIVFFVGKSNHSVSGDGNQFRER